MAINKIDERDERRIKTMKSRISSYKRREDEKSM
jgi:hypothetical protein